MRLSPCRVDLHNAVPLNLDMSSTTVSVMSLRPTIVSPSPAKASGPGVVVFATCISSLRCLNMPSPNQPNFLDKISCASF